MSTENTRLQWRITDDILVVSPEGNILGGAGALPLNKCIQDRLLAGVNRVVLDLSEVDFVNSMGLGVFMDIRTMVSRQKGALAIAAPTTHVLDLLRMTQADKIFTIHKDAETAVAALRKFRS